MISRPADKRLVLFPPELSGTSLKFGYGLGPRYLDLAVATDSHSIKRMSAGRLSTNAGGNQTTDPVISRPADERLVLFPPELSGAPFLIMARV